ncbi:hypothetical protein V5F49_14325 [Xanthobacter sp. V3C-3]|uniref:hypothetical protein n=1 Tax=Xanthobacter lutulentifluminis TaxID=3119935 RepID=UPI0037266D57
MADLVHLSDGQELTREHCEVRVPVTTLRPMLRGAKWAAKFGPITTNPLIVEFVYDEDHPKAAEWRATRAHLASEIYRRAPPSSVIDEARDALSAAVEQFARPEDVLLIVAAFASGRVNIDRVRSADFVEAVAGALINAADVRPVCAAALAAAAQELLEDARFLPEAAEFLRIAKLREQEMKRVLGLLDRLDHAARMARRLLEDRGELEVPNGTDGFNDRIDFSATNALARPAGDPVHLPQNTKERV